MTSPVALGMPAVPAQEDRAVASGITFTTGHHFAVSDPADAAALAQAATGPLSVIVQVTKRCDFACVH